MDQGEIDNNKVVGAFSIKIACAENKYKSLPSPARFLELQSITNKEDIVNLTKYTMTGNEVGFKAILISGEYNKSTDQAEFIWKTYNDLIFKYVIESVSY